MDPSPASSLVFSAAARALRPGGPFVFTYHHNDVEAYAPIVVSLLDAGLTCTATLPAPAEMTASLHIHGTGSSVIDSVFVCRHAGRVRAGRRVGPGLLRRWLTHDRDALGEGGVRASAGDLRCLALGHLARVAAARLAVGWPAREAAAARLSRAQDELAGLATRSRVDALAADIAAPGAR